MFKSNPGERSYAAQFLGLLGDGPRHWLEGHGSDDVRDVEDVVGDVHPVVVKGLEHVGRSILAGEGGGLCADHVALALQDEDVVVLEQVVVGVPGLGGVYWTNSLEPFEDVVWWGFAVVEEEHDPCVEDGSVVGCQDDGGLVVGVVCGKVVNGFEEFGSFVGCEEVVSSPDLVVLGVRLHLVVGDDSEATTAALQSKEEVYIR